MSDNTEIAILAGGCFWILQELLRRRDGVVSTRVGWTGGQNDNPTEENNSGHAEAVEVLFDPERLTYRELLEHFFLVHRPDLGENVVGSAYRSEIFTTTDEQRRVAEEMIVDVDASNQWPGKATTRVSKGRRLLGIRGRRSGSPPALPGWMSGSLPSARCRSRRPTGASKRHRLGPTRVTAK